MPASKFTGRQRMELARKAVEQHEQEGRTWTDIAKEIGVRTKTLREWILALETEQQRPLRAVSVTPPPRISSDSATVEDEPQLRAADREPSPPDGAQYVRETQTSTMPDVLNYAEVETYIAAMYRLAAKMTNDELFYNVIDTHADQTARHWCDWIRTEPRVEAMLRRMMVGTPLGAVIYDHVSIGIGYAFGRAAAADALRRAAESADDAAHVDGAVADAA